MDLSTKVCVFESSNAQEIQLMKSKLEEKNIASEVENAYLSYFTTPTATNLKLKVALKDEKEALDIIDEYLKDNNEN